MIEGWDFRKGAIGGIDEIWRPVKFDYSGWAKNNLPHCINAQDAADTDVKYFQGAYAFALKMMDN